MKCIRKIGSLKDIITGCRELKKASCQLPVAKAGPTRIRTGVNGRSGIKIHCDNHYTIEPEPNIKVQYFIISHWHV